MEIRRLTTPMLGANTYLLSEAGRALVVDPHAGEEGRCFLRQHAATLDYAILTHEHYDHVSGSNWVRETYGCPVVCSRACADRLGDPRTNMSHYWESLCQLHGCEADVAPGLSRDYRGVADLTFEGQWELEWQGHRLLLKETPGHSPGSICLLVDGHILFSGDSLTGEHPTVLRFPGGSRRGYREQTLPWLLSLPDSVVVHPGHFEPFQLGSYRLWEQTL